MMMMMMMMMMMKSKDLEVLDSEIEILPVMVLLTYCWLADSMHI